MPHYKWLDENLNGFWIKVLGKNLNDSGYAGIISAHGDKCYGYHSKWGENDIPFEHGVAIFLLSYTKIYDDEKRSNVCQWVIDNYPKYKEMLL